MNRRQFLKSCGLAAAFIAAPNLAFTGTAQAKTKINDVIPSGFNYGDFDPKLEYRNTVMVEGSSDYAIKRAISVLEIDMTRCVPPRYRASKVSYIINKMEFGRVYSVSWKYSP